MSTQGVSLTMKDTLIKRYDALKAAAHVIIVEDLNVNKAIFNILNLQFLAPHLITEVY